VRLGVDETGLVAGSGSSSVHPLSSVATVLG
jgi:hypothetical protein